MIKALNHVDIIIPKDSDALARKYFCEILGLKEIAKPEVLRKNGGFWLELNNSQLHLSYEKKEGVDPKKTKAHFAFEVIDLKKMEERLNQNGYATKKQEQIPGMLRFESEDPFGHRIEFLQYL